VRTISRATPLLVFAGTLALAVLSATCGARSELDAPEPEDATDPDPPDASVDAPVMDAPGVDAPVEPPVDAEPPSPLCAVPEAGPPGPDAGTCQKTLTLIEIVPSSPACFIDEVVSQVPGELVFPCGGGAATATFGAHVFEGAVTGGVADLCSGTQFPWGDGCEWQSAQHIAGALDDGVLTYTYAEAPAPGQSGCLSACSATGILLAQ